VSPRPTCSVSSRKFATGGVPAVPAAPESVNVVSAVV
jgi:hypothetical protein